MIPSRTLSRYIRGEERKHWGATGELSDLLTSIGVGVKIISSLVATAGFKGLQGYTGKVNAQGEATLRLEEEADQVLIELLGTSGHFGLLVSEERERVVTSPVGRDEGKYVLAFDPLDGSSNIGLNIPIGTIFTIFKKRNLRKPAEVGDFLQPGSKIVAAGYAIYGSKTTFVYSCGDGVHGFTLDPEIGEFVLTEEYMQCPERGSIYSTNEGNSYRWTNEVRRFVERLKEEDKARGTPYTARYSGSMVSDVDRILKRGGIFLYPPDSLQPEGKLRLLYECMPLAFILQQAGGLAVDGKGSILDIVPSSVHQRAPLVIGSRADVERFMSETTKGYVPERSQELPPTGTGRILKS